ncbi:MAG: GumC domain-containing protein [Planctomycetota bacterium]|jgi:uncharacterized protein involved in exopolysaccharide biosynthesis
MTSPPQIELPTISLARYLNLLKRRTFQVVSVSLLGLVVGGLVALVIPRYYVAHTIVQFNRPILDPKLGTPEDPMAQVIEGARVTVGALVEKAITDLGWPEMANDSVEDRWALIENVRRNVNVFDLGPLNKGRTIAKLQISYADTNGFRAKEMANKLRDLWLREFFDNLSRDALGDLQSIQEAIAKTEQDRNILAIEVQSHERQHQLNPDDWREERKGQLTWFTEARARTAERMFAAESDLIRLEQDISYNKSMMEVVEPTLALSGADRFEDPMLRATWVALQQELLQIASLMRTIKPAHPSYGAGESRLKAIRDELAQLEQRAGDTRLEKPNPDYVAFLTKVRQLQAALQTARRTRGQLDDLLTEQDKRLARLPEIFAKYRELLEKRNAVERDLQALQAERRNKEAIIRRINTERPYEVLMYAYQPPAPTVPNRTLVTLAGCLIGLGLAIGLILLLDFLQATYKTVADVEQGLALPVLGSLNHMETDAQRRRVHARRVRLTMISAVLLTLLVCVVTIYYVSPTSLPEIVQQLLSLLLGPTG